MKLYIARDEGIYDDDYNYVKPGKLHLFYDTPVPYYDDETKSIIKIYKLFNKIVFLNLKTNENNIYELN